MTPGVQRSDFLVVQLRKYGLKHRAKPDTRLICGFVFHNWMALKLQSSYATATYVLYRILINCRLLVLPGISRLIGI